MDITVMIVSLVTTTRSVNLQQQQHPLQMTIVIIIDLVIISVMFDNIL